MEDRTVLKKKLGELALVLASRPPGSIHARKLHFDQILKLCDSYPSLIACRFNCDHKNGRLCLSPLEYLLHFAAPLKKVRRFVRHHKVKLEDPLYMYNNRPLLFACTPKAGHKYVDGVVDYLARKFPMDATDVGGSPLCRSTATLPIFALVSSSCMASLADVQSLFTATFEGGAKEFRKATATLMLRGMLKGQNRDDVLEYLSTKIANTELDDIDETCHTQGECQVLFPWIGYD